VVGLVRWFAARRQLVILHRDPHIHTHARTRHNMQEAEDARFMFVIGSVGRGSGAVDEKAALFDSPRGLAFDARRGHLYVADTFHDQVQVFSSDDGSFVGKLSGARGRQAGELERPWDVVIDHERDRVLVVDTDRHRVQAWSLIDHTFLFEIDSGAATRAPREVAAPLHDVLVVSDCDYHRLHVLSGTDLSLAFHIGKRGHRPGEFFYPRAVAIDHARRRIIVPDSNNHRVQVLSLIDGSFLFQFGSKGKQPGQLAHPHALCIDNQGRIIVADTDNCRLQAFTPEGQLISVLSGLDDLITAVAYDEHRGLIACTVGDHRVHVIGANQWLADTFTWRVDRHRYAPKPIKQAVLTMTMIRSVVDESSAMSMIPNELLFEIFSYL